MKKLFFLLMLGISAIDASAQYQQLNIVHSTYTTVNSHAGILIQSTTLNQDKSITVTFKNGNSSNYDTSGEVVTNSFDWYFSYKGKRISDYYTDAARCGRTVSHTAYFWPGTVPAGYEKYVTVQLGREKPKPKKDRRDDD